MAAKKAKKTKKSRTAKKAVKAAARKAPAKKKTAKTAKKKTSARKAAPKTAAKAVKAKKKAGATKKASRKKTQIVGEGDYAATRAFDRDQAAFVKKNKAKIPALAKEAKAALDGPEGASLRQAEAEARRHAAPDGETEPRPGAWVIPPG